MSMYKNEAYAQLIEVDRDLRKLFEAAKYIRKRGHQCKMFKKSTGSPGIF